MADGTRTAATRGNDDDGAIADILMHLARQSLRIERRFAALEAEIAALKEAATDRRAALAAIGHLRLAITDLAAVVERDTATGEAA